jgi:endonuclease III
MNASHKVKLIIARLEKVYPDPKSALVHHNPLELLIATILSAQANDKLVNKVTPDLFKHFKTDLYGNESSTPINMIAQASFDEVDTLIKQVNFHRNKAKNIIGMCKMLASDFKYEIPQTMKELILLPGVARKTANVLLGDAFGTPEGVVVDTHVMRLSRRLGLTDKSDPVKIEQDLMNIVPKKDWIRFSHMLIYFGREYCPARPHICANCPLEDLCPDL